MGDVTNVLVGSADLWIAPANTAAPAFLTSGLVAAPTTPWVASGFTETGVTLNVDRKVGEIHVDEQSTPALVVPDTMDVTVDVTFAEDTLPNMQTAYGGGTITTVAASTGIPGTSVLTLADALSVVAVCFIGTNAHGLGRLVYIPSMVAAGKVKTDYQRAKTNRSYPTTFTATCAPSLVAITDATAVGT